jgi:hypothetical protein
MAEKRNRRKATILFLRRLTKMDKKRELIESTGFDTLMADAQVMLEITYRMEKRHVTAESYIEVPVDGNRAQAIVRTAQSDYPAVKRFLERLVKLQGYEVLNWYQVKFALY